MDSVEIKLKDVVFNDPMTSVVSEVLAGEAQESFSIEVSGTGQLTGLSYTVPAHAEGNIEATLQISAMSSQDVQDLNDLALGMLDASYREKFKETEKTSGKANLSLWGAIFGGSGASASYEKTKETMRSTGLTDEQISMLMEAFLEKAKQMSSVTIKFYINNGNNDYSVSGDLYLYTMSGKVSTEKGTQQYRMLADQGSAGAPAPVGGGAPSAGSVIPLQ